MDDARAHGTKIVLSVPRFAWDGSGRRDTIAFLSRPTARQRFAREVVERGADGVNIDLEPVPDGQRSNFTAHPRGPCRA